MGEFQPVLVSILALFRGTVCGAVVTIPMQLLILWTSAATEYNRMVRISPSDEYME